MSVLEEPAWLDIIVEAYERLGGEAHYSDVYRYINDHYVGRVADSRRYKYTIQRRVEDHCETSRGFKGLARFERVGSGRYRLLSSSESVARLHREPRPGEYVVPAGERVPRHRHAAYVDFLITSLRELATSDRFMVSKDRYCDLLVESRENDRAALLEAKSACGPYDLYCAFGQLQVNARIVTASRRRAVTPVLAFPKSQPSRRSQRILAEIRAAGIIVIDYDPASFVGIVERLVGGPGGLSDRFGR